MKWAPDIEEILSNASDYAIILGNEALPFNIKTQSWLVVELSNEETEIFIKELLERGAKKVQTLEEVKDPNFIHYVLVWNEEKKDWDKVDQSKL